MLKLIDGGFQFSDWGGAVVSNFQLGCFFSFLNVSDGGIYDTY